MKKSLILLVIFSCSGVCSAQNNFQKAYGGIDDDDAKRICRTSDGNFLVAGSTLSYGVGATDAYIMKVDEDGTVLWAQTYGDADDNYFEWAEETDDHGFILCGYTFSVVKQNFKIILLKLDSVGQIEWQNQIVMSSVARAYCIRQTFDGGFILCGEEDSSAIDGSLLLIKLDNLGNLKWNKSFGIPDNADVGHYVIETSDSGFAICGQSRYGLYFSYATVLKTDKQGNMQWSRNYYHLNSSSDRSYSFRILELANGNFILAGSSFIVGQFVSSAHVFRMDSSGNVLWSKLYSTGAGDASHDIVETEDGSGFLICGYSQSPLTGTSNGLVLKLDQNGNQLWNESYGNDSIDTYFYSCVQKDGNKVFLAGNTYSYGAGAQDIFVARRDTTEFSNDCTTNTRSFSTLNYSLADNGPLSYYPLSLALTPLNYATSTGVLASTVCLGTSIPSIIHQSGINIYPNPGKNVLNVDNSPGLFLTTINIYDVLGKLILTYPCNSILSRIELNLPELHKGVYFVKIGSNQGVETKTYLVD